MGYLVGEILFLLMVAFFIGLFFSWLAWGRRVHQTERKLRHAETHRNDAEAKLEAARAEQRRNADELILLTKRLANIEHEHKLCQPSLARMRKERDEARLANEGFSKRLSSLKSQTNGTVSATTATSTGSAASSGESRTSRPGGPPPRPGRATSDQLSLQERTIFELRRQLKQTQNALAEVNTTHDAVKDLNKQWEARFRELEATVKTPKFKENDVEALKNRLKSLESKYGEDNDQINELMAEVEIMQHRLARKSEPQKQKPSFLLNTPTHRKPDDLKKIRGVGPALEKMLNKLGIYYYDQVARLTNDQAEWVDEHLEDFKGRMKRDNWVAQAADLARNESSSRQSTSNATT